MLSCWSYILVFLVCLKGTTLASVVQHVQVDDDHLIATSESNYAIVMQQHGYIWKIVTKNGADVKVTNGLCHDVEHEENDLASYEQMYRTMSKLQPDQIEEMDSQGRGFLDELINEDGSITQKSIARYVAYFILSPEVLIFKTPLSQEATSKFLVSKEFVAIVDARGRIQVRAQHCLSETRREQLQSLVTKLIKARYAAKRASTSQAAGDMQQDYGSLQQNAIWRSLFEPVTDEEEVMIEPDIIRRWLGSLIAAIKRGEVSGVSRELLELLQQIWDAGKVEASKCYTEKARTLEYLRARPEVRREETNIKFYMDSMATEQMDLCVKRLEDNVITHGRQIPNNDRNLLLVFMQTVNLKIDEQPDSGHVLFTNAVIPLNPLYDALASVLHCKGPLAHKEIKKAPKESVKYLLADLIEEEHGKACYQLQKAISEDLKMFDIMGDIRHTVATTGDFHQDAINLLILGRICQLINTQTLDKDRLAVAFSSMGTSSNKFLSCFKPSL